MKLSRLTNSFLLILTTGAVAASILSVASVASAQTQPIVSVATPPPQGKPPLPPISNTLVPIRLAKLHLVVMKNETIVSPSGISGSSTLVCDQTIDAGVYDVRGLQDFLIQNETVNCASTVDTTPVTVSMSGMIQLTDGNKSSSSGPVPHKEFYALIFTAPAQNIPLPPSLKGSDDYQKAWTEDLNLKSMGLNLGSQSVEGCLYPLPSPSLPFPKAMRGQASPSVPPSGLCTSSTFFTATAEFQD
jgi:hypothetical protein